MSQGKLGDRDIADSLPPVLRETVLDQQTNRRRQVARERRPVGFAAQHRRERIADVLAVERAAAGEHLVEHAAERPDVAALVGGPSLRLLGAHVRRGAEDHAHAGIIAGDVIVGELRRALRPRPTTPADPIAFASPKSSTFTVPSGAHLDVRRLQIAMDDALLVRRFERVGDLPRDGQRLVERDRPARDALGERRPSTSSMTSA